MEKRMQIDFCTMERLFKEHHAFLCLIAFGITKDRDAAKDVVQDFFISYWQKRNRVSHTVSFKAYAVKAVKNLSLLSLKRAEKEKSVLQDLKLRHSVETKSPGDSNTRQKLHLLLDRLPESRRHIFMSSVLHGQSYSEIAESNGISINTVKTQMKRAYAFLRREATDDLLYVFLFAFSALQ